LPPGDRRDGFGSRFVRRAPELDSMHHLAKRVELLEVVL
jgi:hypothetical protein